VATLREKKPGVWEVRVFTGTDARGRPTQVSRTARGGKRDAQRLAASLEVGPGSASAARRLTLDPDMLNAIWVLRREREPYGPWMFVVGPDLVPPDHIGWWWTRARKNSGIDMKWRLHDLRHWSATVSIGQGHDVRTVAGRLGHSNPAMTLRVTFTRSLLPTKRWPLASAISFEGMTRTRRYRLLVWRTGRSPAHANSTNRARSETVPRRSP